MHLTIFKHSDGTDQPSHFPKGILGLPYVPTLVGLGLGIILPILIIAAPLSTHRASVLTIATPGVGGVTTLAVNNIILSAATSKLASETTAATLSLGPRPTPELSWKSHPGIVIWAIKGL